MKNLYQKIVEGLHSISYERIDESLVVSEEDILEDIKSFNDYEMKDKYGRTVLMYASLYGRNTIIKDLCEKGADLFTKDKNEWTPLHATVNNNNFEGTKILLKYGAKVDVRDVWGNYPIHKLKHYDSDDIAKLLLKYGANPYVKNNAGVSIIEMYNAYPHILELLENTEDGSKPQKS